ncbi:MAG: pitrilysin family protein [Bacteroidota bacterium]|nr:pitrilysin family protein [Bacteroidota bacterium]
MKDRHASIPSALVIALLACATTRAQTWVPAVEKMTLANGLTVVLHRDTAVPYITVNIAFHAGSSRDPQGLHGLASVSAHVYTAALPPGAEQKLRSLRIRHAVTYNTLTNVDWNNFVITAPADVLESLLSIEADRMRNRGASATDSLIGKVTAALLAQRVKTAKQPLAAVQERVFAEVYPDGHPYRHLSTGDTTDLRNTKPEDVRKFIRLFFNPSHASITIGGDIRVEEAKRLVRKYFADIPPAKPIRWPPDAKNCPAVPAASLVHTADVDFSTLQLTFATVPLGDPDEAPLKMLASLLTGSGVSRLKRFFRTFNPYVLDVQASQSSQELHGTFQILLTCRPEADLRKVFEQAMNVLDEIRDGEITADDLLAARNQTEMQILSPLESIFGFGGRCDAMNLDNLYTGNPAATSARIQAMQSVGPSTLRAVLGKYFTKDRVIVLSVVQPTKKDNAVLF